MKRLAMGGLCLAAAAGLGLALQDSVGPGSGEARAAPAGACAFPTAPSATPEETAWKLFVAANCPANAGKVVWENWIEQAQLYPANAGPGAAAAHKRLHGSPLARIEALRRLGAAKVQAPNTSCNAMNGPPNNVVPGATICEEVHLNPEAVAFIKGAGYQARPGQTKAAQGGVNIQFPKPAIEVKVDWIPGTDFKPGFTCAKPPSGVHVETIDGVCYAMAGIHISSKLLTDWEWATFEPQSMTTNPLRCITFGSCSDAWGATPAVSNGGASGFTSLTPAAKSLIAQARLAPEFANYRLDGAQLKFTTPTGTPTYLGNSVIEGENVGMTKNTASCITCHSVSTIKDDGSDGFGVLVKIPPPVGARYKVPAHWIARDFVWSMALACPDPTQPQLQKCVSPAPAAKAAKKP
jgi:hypothetical protein